MTLPAGDAPASPALHGVGIGLRHPHYEAVLEGAPPLAFVEVHAENFFADGGAALEVLRQARARYPVSLHGVGLGLGSAAGLDAWHLERLARLVERIEPMKVSDHACFARASVPGAGTVHAGDLLPLPANEAALDLLAANVERVQDRLRRPILVENIAAYLPTSGTTWAEPEFFARLCRRSGCGLLLDLNNLMVNALNDGAGASALAQCKAWVDALPPDVVGEIHLAGYAETPGLVVDDHGSRVRPDVWDLLGHTLRRCGPRAVLVEWDTDLPPLGVLLGEAKQAAAVAAGIFGAPDERVAARQ
jgi:uncharacterized protein (UPF0276 family)